MSRWIIFISMFLTIYGSMHLYLLIKVRRAYYLESWGYFLIVALLLFLMLAPIQARVLESQSQHNYSIILSWIGYLWMGSLFVWIWLSLALDIYHLIVIMFQRLFCADWIQLMLSRRQGLHLTILITVGLMIYGLYAAQNIPVKQVNLHSEKIPAGKGRVRLVQISDVHLGQVIFPGRLERIVQTVNAAEPDILVSTGDLIDGTIYDPDAIVQKLQQMKAKLGKFAVTGNHEAYAGIKFSTDFAKAAGFRMLQQSSVSPSDCLSLAGVDDPAFDGQSEAREPGLLTELPEKHYKILLKHQPRVTPASKGLFDLQLSGHTHKGQIFPFNLVVNRVYPFFCGMHALPWGGRIYVSRGTGTWGPPIRIGALPEITVIDLLPINTAQPPHQTVGTDKKDNPTAKNTPKG